MATYAIGDVQGCYDELQALLSHIRFEPTTDRLWFAGDLVNRGRQSLHVLRFLKALPNVVVTLGNHDLYLLALASGKSYQNHTLQEVLRAPDHEELINWLRQRPLFYCAPELGYAMSHAGIPPQWTLAQAHQYAQEIATWLQSEQWKELMAHMIGNEPEFWQEDLSGWARLRYIMNAFTRLRFCDANGRLELTYKGKVGSQPKGYLPWFAIPGRRTQGIHLLFGHWASLLGNTHEPTVHALDTGCVWGYCLTAMRLEDGQRFSVPCSKC